MALKRLGNGESIAGYDEDVRSSFGSWYPVHEEIDHFWRT
jgi:hypothetical protein